MMHLQFTDHSGHLLEALQKSEHNIRLRGNDHVTSDSNNLWIFSPLVRSIGESLKNIEDNLIILPDFSNEDIKDGLDVIDGNEIEVWSFDLKTKTLLETLGVKLTCTQTQTVNYSPRSIDREHSGAQIQRENIKRESINEIYEHEDEDNVHKLLLERNNLSDSDDDDKEEEEEKEDKEEEDEEEE